MSKGSTRRPPAVPDKQIQSNWDKAFPPKPPKPPKTKGK